MKMVKCLLLGTAASLATVTTGQATELPVKAAPVDYVKVCNIYGSGFYYMPGTDMCLKIGGWVRSEAVYNANGSTTWGVFNGNQNNRSTSDLTVRARGYITADARELTEFGVARAYIAVGLSTNTTGSDGASNTFSSNRAFLQWAGFTAGLASSFFDFYNGALQNYRAGYLPHEDTGDAGLWVWAYTAQLGGGWTATLSAENRRMNQIINVGTAVGAPSALAVFSKGTGFGGWKVPDLVGNVRIDQTWGSAQIMAAAHEVNPLYYGSLATSGHPGDQWGWAAGAGLHLDLPFIWPGDYVEGEYKYGQGALTDLVNSAGTTMTFANGGEQSYGLTSDCVFGGTLAAGNATGCHLTTGWNAIASYEHYWTPQWHQSITGGILQVDYDHASNNLLCALEGQATGVGSHAVAHAGCNNNWNYWVVGSRLQWDVTRSFYVGVEALYFQQDTASSATGLVPAVVGLPAPAVCAASPAVGGGCRDADAHAWVFTVRMHKDFLP